MSETVDAFAGRVFCVPSLASAQHGESDWKTQGIDVAGPQNPVVLSPRSIDHRQSNSRNLRPMRHRNRMRGKMQDRHMGQIEVFHLFRGGIETRMEFYRYAWSKRRDLLRLAHRAGQARHRLKQARARSAARFKR